MGLQAIRNAFQFTLARGASDSRTVDLNCSEASTISTCSQKIFFLVGFDLTKTRRSLAELGVSLLEQWLREGNRLIGRQSQRLIEQAICLQK